MSADIWLVDAATGERIEVNAADLDAQMRSMAPMRSATSVDVTTFNLTYNLTPMLREAGMPPWDAFLGCDAVAAGLVWESVYAALVADPDRFKALNPKNGWGTYEGAVEVLGALAAACKAYPTAKIDGWL